MNDDITGKSVDDISSFDLVSEKQDRRSHVADLVQTIKETADKLAAEGTTRGDIKILSRTLRELRYAFKVFSPYRRKSHRCQNRRAWFARNGMRRDGA